MNKKSICEVEKNRTEGESIRYGRKNISKAVH